MAVVFYAEHAVLWIYCRDVFNRLCHDTRKEFEASKELKDFGEIDYKFQEAEKRLFAHPEPYICTLFFHTLVLQTTVARRLHVIVSKRRYFCDWVLFLIFIRCPTACFHLS